MSPGIEIVRLAPRNLAGLTEFFAEIAAAGEDRLFHPHPFTAEKAAELTEHRGEDLYYVATQGDRVLGYAMLRGWDEGYAVPSLGIAIAKSARGGGLARAVMLFLHAAARLRGAPSIRLKVYADNLPARKLYESLGYQFEPAGERELLGILRFPS